MGAAMTLRRSLNAWRRMTAYGQTKKQCDSFNYDKIFRICYPKSSKVSESPLCKQQYKRCVANCDVWTNRASPIERTDPLSPLPFATGRGLG